MQHDDRWRRVDGPEWHSATLERGRHQSEGSEGFHGCVVPNEQLAEGRGKRMDQRGNGRSACTRRDFLQIAVGGLSLGSLLAACAAPAPTGAPAAPPTALPKPTVVPTAAVASAPTAASNRVVSTQAAAAAKPTNAPKPAPVAATTAPTTASGAGDWRAEWDRTVVAARQEGRVVVFGPSGDVIRRAMTEEFPKAYPGINLEWNGGSGSQNATKLEAERRAGVFSVDVFIGGTTTANTQLKPMGAVDPILPVLVLPEVTDPKAWLDGALDFSDKDQLNLVFVTIPQAPVIYNSTQVQVGEIQELSDLLNPKWKDKMVINDPTASGPGNVTFRFFWDKLGPEEGAKFIRAIRAQAPQNGGVDRDARRMIEGVARGRFLIGLGQSDGVQAQLEEQGVTTFGRVHAFKTHGGSATSSFGSVVRVKNAPHPNAQKVFLNWLLTKEGQLTYSKAMDQASRRLDVPVDHLSPESRIQQGTTYWKSYHEDAVLASPEFTALLKETFGGAAG